MVPPIELTPIGIASIVIIAPTLETALLATGLWILRPFTAKPMRLAALSAALWGLLHGSVAPMWFFGTVWSFFVFSAAYISWRQESRAHAFLAAACIHGFVNLAVVLLTFIERV